MIDEKLFGHAIVLATAFIQNGDLRIQKEIRNGTAPFDMLEDLIPVLYCSLQVARREIESVEAN